MTVTFPKENLTFTSDKENPFQRLQLQLIGSVAEFERSMIRERQREGIAISKAAGRYKSGKPGYAAPDILIEMPLLRRYYVGAV